MSGQKKQKRWLKSQGVVKVLEDGTTVLYPHRAARLLDTQDCLVFGSSLQEDVLGSQGGLKMDKVGKTMAMASHRRNGHVAFGSVTPYAAYAWWLRERGATLREAAQAVGVAPQTVANAYARVRNAVKNIDLVYQEYEYRAQRFIERSLARLRSLAARAKMYADGGAEDLRGFYWAYQHVQRLLKSSMKDRLRSATYRDRRKPPHVCSHVAVGRGVLHGV